MSPSKPSFAYIATIVVFGVILVFGTYVLNWAQTHYGVALIIFFLVLLGIRLDEIAQQLREVQQHLQPAPEQPEAQTPPEQPEEPQGHLSAIRDTLSAIHDTLERLEARKP
jgi:DNA-binding transcriptional MerR regulator